MTRTDTVDVAAILGYGELALALYAAPYALPAVAVAPVDDILCRAADGVASLGGVAAVQALYRVWRDLNADLLRGVLPGGDYETRIRRQWPDPDRFDLCLSLAYTRFWG